MSAKLKIKKGDKVVVITGKDKGKQGEVVQMLPSENRAVVRGVNMAKRHTRQTASQEGGIISKEDMEALRKLGVGDLFGPGTSTGAIIDYVRGWVAANRAGN